MWPMQCSVLESWQRGPSRSVEQGSRQWLIPQGQVYVGRSSCLGKEPEPGKDRIATREHFYLLFDSRVLSFASLPGIMPYTA